MKIDIKYSRKFQPHRTSVSFSYIPEGIGFSRSAQRFHGILLIGVTRSQASFKKTGNRPQCAKSASLRNIFRFTVHDRNFLVAMTAPDEDWAAEVDEQERQISGEVSYCRRG